MCHSSLRYASLPDDVGGVPTEKITRRYQHMYKVGIGYTNVSIIKKHVFHFGARIPCIVLTSTGTSGVC
jgi:hypothetical protein